MIEYVQAGCKRDFFKGVGNWGALYSLSLTRKKNHVAGKKYLGIFTKL